MTPVCVAIYARVSSEQQATSNTIDHTILLKLLEKRIDDPRFIGVIKSMLEAGYMDDWVFGRTYSGTPQGGIATPPTMVQNFLSIWR